MIVAACNEREAPRPAINGSLCTACGLCVELCPTSALDLVDDQVVLSRPEDCAFCDQCEEICPVGAIGDRVWRPVFVIELCNGCELCIDICPAGGLAIVSGAAQLTVPRLCVGCHDCEEICPTGAIFLSPFPRDAEAAAPATAR